MRPRSRVSVVLHGPFLLILPELYLVLFISQNSSRVAEDKNIMSESTTSPNYIELAADIVSAYVSNNSVPAADLPLDLELSLIRLSKPFGQDRLARAISESMQNASAGKVIRLRPR